MRLEGRESRRTRPTDVADAPTAQALLASSPSPSRALAAEAPPRRPAGGLPGLPQPLRPGAYLYPRHGAAPLGLIGFEVYADATYDEDFDDEPFIDTVIDDDLTGGFLSVARVGARKGLPAASTSALSYGRALESDVELVSAEIQYAILKGGLVKPALSLRVTGSRSLDSEAYDLDQYGAEVLLARASPCSPPTWGPASSTARGPSTRACAGRSRRATPAA